MATMSFGEHIEELRVRLILALLGLFVGVIVVFLPPLDIAYACHEEHGSPGQGGARRVLQAGVRQESQPGRGREGQDAHCSRRRSPPISSPASSRRSSPELALPDAATLEGQDARVADRSSSSADMIRIVQGSTVQIDQSLVSLAPLETLTIFFMVALVSGLVLASPWVFYQAWAFVAAGLYRHERALCEEIPAVLAGAVPDGRLPLLLLRAADHAEVPAPVQRLPGRRSDAPAQRMDGLRHDPAADLRPVLPDAAGHAVPGADQYLHRRRFPGEAEDSRS